MLRAVGLALVFALSTTVVQAGDTGLKRLDTGDEGREWEAVGRLDINGQGICTAALIEPDLVLTAAHCLFNKTNGERIDHGRFEFRAGWRNGRAAAYRNIKRAVIHPDYDFSNALAAKRVRNDLALLELDHPIRNTTVVPFETEHRPARGARIGVVSYAQDRIEAPSIQEICKVMGRQQGVLVMSCDVDFGSSGAPVFSFDGPRPRIVSVVSAKAEINGEKVALGTQLETPLGVLKTELATARGAIVSNGVRINRLGNTSKTENSGAKFVKSNGG